MFDVLKYFVVFSMFAQMRVHAMIRATILVPNAHTVVVLLSSIC